MLFEVASSAGTGTEFAVTVRVNAAGPFPALFPQLDALVKESLPRVARSSIPNI